MGEVTALLKLLAMTQTVSGTVIVTAIGMLLAYMIGSIPSGYMVGRIAKGIDIREFGSGSTGTTNVLRTVGPVAAGFTVFSDFFKGVLVVVMGRLAGMPEVSVVLIGLATVAGHNWPVFLRFKGGRGVATGFGVSLGLTWQISAGLFVLWLIIIAASRYVSLASIIVMVLYPVMIIYFHEPLPVIIFGFLGAGTIIFMHRKNIVRLVRGEESKVGQKLKEDKDEEK